MGAMIAAPIAPPVPRAATFSNRLRVSREPDSPTSCSTSSTCATFGSFAYGSLISSTGTRRRETTMQAAAANANPSPSASPRSWV